MFSLRFIPKSNILQFKLHQTTIKLCTCHYSVSPSKLILTSELSISYSALYAELSKVVGWLNCLYWSGNVVWNLYKFELLFIVIQFVTIKAIAQTSLSFGGNDWQISKKFLWVTTQFKCQLFRIIFTFGKKAYFCHYQRYSISFEIFQLILSVVATFLFSQ